MYWHSAMYRARRKRFFMLMRMARLSRTRAYLMAFYDPSEIGRAHEYTHEEKAHFVSIDYHRYHDYDGRVRVTSSKSGGLEAESIQL